MKAQVCFLGVIMSASVAAAVPILDQQQTESNGGIAFWSDRSVAQTFVPGISGTFAGLELPVYQTSSTAYHETMHVSLVRWSGSGPSQALGTISQPTPFVSSPATYIDFSSLHIQVTAGSMYAFILTNDYFYSRTPSPVGLTCIKVRWRSDLYTRGGLWCRDAGVWMRWPYGATDTDAQFKSFVVPEPASLGLVIAAGLVAFGPLRRRQGAQNKQGRSDNSLPLSTPPS